MADVAPFRAIRYAHPSPALVAPPYDVVSPAERDVLLERSPYNVAQLTLADSEEEAGDRFRRWLDDGVLVRDEAPAVWVLEQHYVGPDGVERTRLGLASSLRVEPYEAGIVLPHERTHAGPREERLRLLRETQAQLEPIFLVYEGAAPLARPDREPDLAVEGSRLWRVEDVAGVANFFAARQLLIADGHHRYEAALAYRAEAGTEGSARLLAVLVSASDPGLEIFPTHRVFTARPDIVVAGEAVSSPEEALDRVRRLPYERAAAVAYRAGEASVLEGGAGQLDVELVDRFGHEGIGYTPDWREAVARVDRGAAGIAFLLRAARVEDVFARARRGELLPQKTTYFFPKLLSGLLFHPLTP